MGWCLLIKENDTYTHIDHGVLGVKYDTTTPWNAYRHKLIKYWAETWPDLTEELYPDLIVSEKLPPGGSAIMGGNTQRIAGIVAISICQLLNYQGHDTPWEEVAATTIKNSFFTKEQRKEKSFKSKIAVRNVICTDVWPELYPVRTKLLPDESDAMSIALYGAGYRHVVE